MNSLLLRMACQTSRGGGQSLPVAVCCDSTHGSTEFMLRTQPISGGPIRFLSEATNDVILAGWRRIQFMDTGNTSDPHRCGINKAKRKPDIDCTPTLTIPPTHLRVPKTSRSLPPVRHARVSLYMSCVNTGCHDQLRFDADLFISTFR